MKKLLALLVIVGIVAACGKNNSTGASSSSTNNWTGGSVYSAMQTGGYISIDNYRNDIQNNRFASLKESTEYFDYVSMVAAYTSTTTCKGGWFLSFCYPKFESNDTSSGNSFSTVIAASNDNIDAKKAELLGYLNGYYPFYYSADYKVIQVQTSSGYVVIDFRLPIQANPVLKYTNSTGTYKTLMNDDKYRYGAY